MINNNIVQAIGSVAMQEINGNEESPAKTMLNYAFSPTLTIGFGFAIIYSIYMGVTFSFLIIYIRRMIITAFLIAISPLITVTYAIDKMGDREVAGCKYMDERIYLQYNNTAVSLYYLWLFYDSNNKFSCRHKTWEFWSTRFCNNLYAVYDKSRRNIKKYICI